MGKKPKKNSKKEHQPDDANSSSEFEEVTAKDMEINEDSEQNEIEDEKAVRSRFLITM